MTVTCLMQVCGQKYDHDTHIIIYESNFCCKKQQQGFNDFSQNCIPRWGCTHSYSGRIKMPCHKIIFIASLESLGIPILSQGRHQAWKGCKKVTSGYVCQHHTWWVQFCLIRLFSQQCLYVLLYQTEHPCGLDVCAHTMIQFLHVGKCHWAISPAYHWPVLPPQANLTP